MLLFFIYFLFFGIFKVGRTNPIILFIQRTLNQKNWEVRGSEAKKSHVAKKAQANRFFFEIAKAG